MLVMIYSVWLAVLKALPSARAVAPTYPPKYYLLEQIAPAYILLLLPPKWAGVQSNRILQKKGENYTGLATGLCSRCGVFFPPPQKHTCQKTTIL